MDICRKSEAYRSGHFCGIIYNWNYFSSLHQFSPFSRGLFEADVADMTRRVIEAVITSCTRNAVVLYRARGFESHTLRQKPTSTSGFAACGLFSFSRFLEEYFLCSLLKWTSSLLIIARFHAKNALFELCPMYWRIFDTPEHQRYAFLLWDYSQCPA